MMRRIISFTLIFAVGLTFLAGPTLAGAPFNRHPRIISVGARDIYPRQSVIKGSLEPIASFLTNKSLPGIASMTAFEEAVAPHLSGRWFYIRGDGTNRPGAPITMTPVNAPVTRNHSVMSGLNGFVTSSQRLNGTTQSFTSANVTAPSGNFTMAWLGTIDGFATNPFLIGKFLSGAGMPAIQVQALNADASITTQFYKVGDILSIVGTGAGLMRDKTLHFVVVTYKFVTDGTSQVVIYHDGFQQGQAANVVGPIQTTATTPWTVGQRAGSAFVPGNMLAAFMTEKALSYAEVKALANLVLTPNLPQNPFTFAVARASAGTHTVQGRVVYSPNNFPRLGSGGMMIEKSTQNQVTQSEAGASWTSTTTSTLTANADFAPDGTLTATRVTEAAVNAACHGPTVANVVAGSGRFVASVFVKAGSINTAAICILGDSDNCTYANLGTGTVTPGQIGGSPSAGVTSSIEAYADGWYRIAVHGCANPGSPTNLQVSTRNCATSTVGNTANNILAWGFMLEQANGRSATNCTSAVDNPKPSPYIRTTTAAVTRLADDVTSQLRLFSIVHDSEDFSQATWTKTNVTISAATGDTAAPDGTMSANKLTVNAGAAQHTLSGTGTSVANRYYAQSVYGKAGTDRFLYMGRTGFHQYIVADLSDCTLAAVSADANATNATAATRFGPFQPLVTSAGNGWCRLQSLIQMESTTGTHVIASGPTLASVNPATGSAPTYNATGTGTVYVWGANIASPNVPGDANTSDYPYISCQGEVLPGQSTISPCNAPFRYTHFPNMAPNSESLDNWSENEAGGATVTVTANAAVAPNGTTTAERVTFTAVGVGQAAEIFTTPGDVAISGGELITMSFWARTVDNAASATATIRAQAIAVPDVGADRRWKDIVVNNTWRRYLFRYVQKGNGNGSTLPTIRIGANYSLNGNIATSAADVYIWGVNVIEGEFYSEKLYGRTTSSLSVSALQSEGLFSADVDRVRVFHATTVNQQGNRLFGWTNQNGVAGNDKIIFFNGSETTLSSFGTAGLAFNATVANADYVPYHLAATHSVGRNEVRISGGYIPSTTTYPSLLNYGTNVRLGSCPSANCTSASDPNYLNGVISNVTIDSYSEMR